MMAVNLSKHGSELSDVYNEVVSGNTGTDWVLFTYEEKSYDIKVAATGDGGLDELVEELSMGKVMYGFCRVTDPNLGVPKFILINWTGEGVTGVMRGVCANHFRTMASFLRGAHVTINAYSEDDVEPELIMKKVFQSVGVNYRMQNESRLLTNAAASHPAGSAYRKTSALDEIKGKERENFWAQIEKEEETRHQQERKKAEEERQRAEKEKIQQEERETAERDRRQRERARQIDQQRMQEKKQEATSINQQNTVEQELQAAQWKGIRSSRSVQEANGSKHYKSSALEEINGTDREHFWAQLEKEEKTRRQQERKKAEEERQRAEKERIQQEERETAERDRRQRERVRQIDQQRMQEKKQEATTINQHNAVEQELQAAQWKGIRSSRSVQEANLAAAIISQRAVDPRETFSQKATNFLTNKSSETQSECNKDKRLNENIYDISSNHRSYEVVKDERTAEVKGLYAEALYDYQAADDTEITFDPGDIITVVEMADEGWWHGYGPDGYYGMFPANYVKLI